MIVDAHVHLDGFADALPRALEEIARERILTVAVAMDIESWETTRRIADGNGLIIPTFGVHPWRAPRYRGRLAELDAPLAQTPLVGEAGLDFHWVTDREWYPAQREVFEYQCHQAARMGKPMNLHTKGGETEILDCLRRYRVPASLVHWYSGPLDLVEDYLSEGAYFTVGVEVFHSPLIQQIARVIPEDRLLLETDNPGGHEWLTKEPGTPRLILRVEQEVAALRGVPSAHLRERTWQNWLRFSNGLGGRL